MSPETRPLEPGTHAGTSASTVPDDLVSMLGQLAQTIVAVLRYGVAVVNLARPDGSFQVVTVAGDEDARRVLLGHVDTGETWEKVLSVSEPWGLLRFADHRNQDADPTVLSWVPDVDVIDDAEDAWHPEDSLFAPLVSAGGTWLGILSVDLPHDGRRPNEASRRALEAFAMAAALAIEHSTLRARSEAAEEVARELAARDPLTGVGNRSMMMQRLKHAASARAGQRKPLALVFIDMDDFKRVNDLHSHAAGDHLLRVVAERIQSVVRPHDTVVRWGGDEFLVLLEDLDDEASGQRAADRISEVIAGDVTYAGLQLRVSASVGLAFHGAHEDLDPDALVRHADTAMYQVKNGQVETDLGACEGVES